MESLIILIPIALIFIAIAIKIFFWAVDNGQFDDLEGPAHSILFDDHKPIKQRSAKAPKPKKSLQSTPHN